MRTVAGENMERDWHGRLIVSEDIEVRFFDKVIMWPSGCWMWTGAFGGKMQYGCFWQGEKNELAHRWSYKRFVGPLTYKDESHHMCENSRCVNPYHLKIMTRAEHSKTKNYRNVSHCPKGHPYAGDNLIVVNRNRGGGSTKERRCRACKRRQDYEFRDSKKSGAKSSSMD